MLVLLMTAATGAWADTTVTWTASDVSRIYIDFLDGEANNNTIKGITVTSSGGGSAGASWEGTDIDLNSGSTTITFTSSVGNIKSIAITAENIDMSSIPSGWTTDYSTLSWSGVASSTVSLPLSGGTDISEISGIVFTIEPPTVAVTGVTLAPTSATLTLGETETVTLIPTVLPAEATDKSVTWSSSDEAVATVTDGVVTAVAAGTATITVTTTDGAKTATCAVTVAAPAASTYTVTLKEGTEDATSWTIAPAEATTTGVAAGTEVKATYSGMKKVKSVKAKKAAPANVAVTSITLNKTATEITVGQTETLSVTEVLPANATDPTYTWKTSDETKATVDQNGVVTAVAAGNVNIYAEANDGSEVQGTCAVTVKVAPTLANTLTNAGMTVKVMYNYSGDGDDVRESSCSFLSKGGGNYDFVEGSGWSGGDSRCAKALVVEDDKLVFKLNMYEDFNDMWDAYGFSVTFDTGNNTYIQWKGSDVRKNSSLISVEVNNQPINNSLTERKITVDDLDTEGCEDWEQIVEKNPDLICADDDDFIRRMTDNAKLMASEDGGNSWYEVLWNDSWEPDFTYKFEVVDETGD